MHGIIVKIYYWDLAGVLSSSTVYQRNHQIIDFFFLEYHIVLEIEPDVINICDMIASF